MLNIIKKIFTYIKRILIMLIKLLFILAISGATLLIIARLTTAIHSKGRVYEIDDIPAERAAIVFGAGLWRDGTPTPVLRDRIQAGAELYFAGKVEKLLMSGDNRFADYDEPTAMKNYAIELGVPENDIVLDFAGRRTYDTCYRAKEIFGLDSAILVTQEFHLSRALYICDALGVESTGINGDRRTYLKRSRFFWNTRETLATLTAFWDLYVTRPFPVLGEFEPIFTEE
jgi:vancomycin permeability regulator SanA